MLGPVQIGIGAVQQGFMGEPLVTTPIDDGADPEARGNPYLRPGKGKQVFGDSQAQTICYLDGVVEVGEGQYQKELLATIAGDPIDIVTDHPLHLCHHLLENEVTRLVAMGVVDAFEMIEIAEENGDGVVVSPRPLHFPGQVGVDATPVKASGQGVSHRNLADLFNRLLEFEGPLVDQEFQVVLVDVQLLPRFFQRGEHLLIAQILEGLIGDLVGHQPEKVELFPEFPLGDGVHGMKGLEHLLPVGTDFLGIGKDPPFIDLADAVLADQPIGDMEAVDDDRGGGVDEADTETEVAGGLPGLQRHLPEGFSGARAIGVALCGLADQLTDAAVVAEPGNGPAIKIDNRRGDTIGLGKGVLQPLEIVDVDDVGQAIVVRAGIHGDLGGVGRWVGRGFFSEVVAIAVGTATILAFISFSKGFRFARKVFAGG